MTAETKPREAVAIIAGQLGETDMGACVLIKKIVQLIGPDQTQIFVYEALEVEKNGGMMTNDGERRRTPGGVFFRLVRDKLSPAQRHVVWPGKDWKQKREKDKARRAKARSAAPTSAPQPQPQQAQPIITTITNLDTKGNSVMKCTVVGRPAKISPKEGHVILIMQSNKTYAVPKGVPAPSTTTQNFVCLVATKQWQRAAESLEQDEEDQLILEGFPRLATNAEGKSFIRMYCTSCTTKKLQQAKRQRQSA